jgi:hypothetical protein
MGDLSSPPSGMGDLSSPPSGMGDLSRFWLSYLGPFALSLPNTFKVFGFQIFRFCAYLRVVRTKFDIYIFIETKISAEHVAYCLFLKPIVHRRKKNVRATVPASNQE